METNLGRVTTARAYSFALINGVANTFRCSPEDLLCAVEKGSSASDVNIIKAGFAVGTGTTSVIQKVLVDFLERRAYINDPTKFEGDEGPFWSLGEALVNEGSAYGTVFTASPRVKLAGGIVVAAAAVVIITTVVISLVLGMDSAQVVAVVLRGVALGIAVQCTIQTFARQWTKWQAAADHPSFMDFSKSKFGLKWDMTLKLGLVFTFISVAITWGAFVTQFFVTDMKWGSMSTDSAFAGAIAATIVTVILFLIFTALGPIGAIVGAIFGLINAMASLICSALPQKMQSSKAGVWLCGGITGAITNLMKRLIYSGTIMVKMAPTDYDRLSLHHFDTKLADEEAGVVVGNKMIYSVQLTNTIDLVSVPISLWEGDWGYQFNDANLMQANFGYRWQESQNNFHSELSLGSMPGGWQRTYGGRPFYTAKPAASEGIPLRKAGINRPVEGLYLSEAYAVPEQECWGFLAIGKCSIEAEKSTSHFDMGSDLVYDVLPPTLDGFYELKQEDDGWALAWGQEGDLTFQTLFDADGDGLSRTDDPDDSNWDADADGLSDVYELNTGSDPTEQDTDDDGLTDHQEAQFGSNPASADGDGDGLYDCQEVFHEILTVGDENVREACGDVVHDWSGGWTIVYGTDEGAPTITHVTSNPVEVDTEGDGLTDRQEQVYGYNPRVWSIANVLALSSELSEVDNGVYEPTDGFVAPGQTLHYNATVKNKLDSRQAEGLLWTETTPFLDMSKLRPQPFNLRPQTQASMAGTLSVLNKASGAYSITQVAGALIENLAIESNEAALWLRFDDATAPFADWSGSLPPHDGACFDGNGASATACAQDAAGGRIGGGLKLAGTGYVEVPLNVSEGAYALALWFKTTCTTCGIFSVDKGTRGAGGHDRHVYLNAGNVCARVYSNETKCTSGTNYADGQWHHVVHTFGGTEGGQKIYLDGVLGITPGLKAASDFTAQDGINIGFSNDAALGYFTGSIDDVRLFSSALDQTEVRALANLPLFHMNFDQTDRWADVSSFKTTVSDCVPCTTPYPNNRPPFCATSSCRSYYGPAHDTMAVHGSAANFNGSTYLSVPGGPTAPQLDLGGGRFTLSAWIYPRTHGDARDTHAQGILGLNSGNSNAFPTLQRVGKEIRFSLGTGAAWVTPYTSSGNVLTENQWNHVAVTLNKDEGLLRLYVNGELKGNPQPFAVPAIAATKSFDIGRSSSTATVRAYNYTQGEHGDGGLSCECILGNGSEMCMALDSQEVWDQDGDLCCTEKGSLDATRSFAGSTTLVLWEDDDDPHCGTGPSQAPTNAGNDDDTCTFTSPSTGNQLQFSTRDASFSGRDYEFNNCGTGDFRVTLTNNSVPFYGYMDELQIYGQTLDQDAIRQLYLDAATLLRLPLDEAPGATAFEDLSLAHVPAFCAASGCPASGTTGRINQAAQFDSSKSAISLGHSAANELAKSFTVAAWIKPNSVSGVRNIVSTARTTTNNGWGFRLSGGNLAFEPYGYGTSSTTSLGLQSGRWTHVAAVVDAANAVTFYVNGAKWESMEHAGYYGGTADTDDLMLVGAAQELGAAAPSQFFDGQIDDLWVFNMPLSPARITELYERAPVMHLLFDEATGAHQFADNAAYGRFGTCTADGACPLAGEGVRGQVGLAAQFDGLNDNVKIDNFGDFTKTTVSAWVYRTGGTTARETIVSYKENSSCGFVLDLNDDAKNHYPRFYVRVQPASGSATWQSVTFPQSVPSGTWVHLAGTYDGSKIRLYQNGVLQAESNGTVAAGSMLNTCTDNTGIGSHNSLNQHWFPGAIDEVQIYGRALTSGQIRDLYLYQSAWVESRQSRDITVDNDPPTAKLLIANGSYLADQTIWIGVTANDPTSDVDKVELRVDKGSVEGTWRTAARCTKNTDQPEGAWCAQFTPWGDPSQGAYSLFARATDRVGRTGPYDKVGVYVDDAAPTLVLNQISYALVDARMSGKKPQTWVVHLSGVVKDPLIATNVQGSGVPVDGVRVTLRDAEGEPLGDAGQTATVSGDGWSLDYTIREAEPDGCYEVEVEAEDQVARIPNLDPYQVGRHTTMVSDRIVLESSAPQVLLDQQPAIAGRQLGPGVTSLGGETTHRPVPVEVDLTATTGADKTRVLLTCQHGNEGSWYTLFDLQAGTLKAGSTQVWEGDIHQWSTCRVDLTTTATPVGGVGGVVKVCGTQIADWSDGFAGSKTVEFVVYSDSCGAPGCPVGSPPPVAGVQGVDLAFRSVLPGSAFLNEVPLGGRDPPPAVRGHAGSAAAAWCCAMSPARR